MVIKHLGIFVVAALCSWGCREGGSDRRVAELISQQKEQAEHISQVADKIDSVDKKLAAIEKSVNALTAGGSDARPRKAPEMTVASDFASTKEYQNIMQHIAVLQEQLAAVQGDFTGFRDRQREAGQRDQQTDRGAAWRAMGDPREMSGRLDNLAKNFSGRIADPVTKDQFVADVENLKRKYATSLSPEERTEQARALIADSLSTMTDERRRGWLEGQLRSLDEASGEELQRRVDFTLQFQRMREISELTQKYQIPREVVTDSGLVSFDRGGPPGFGPGRGR